MPVRHARSAKTQVPSAKRHNTAATARDSRRARPASRRSNVGQRNSCEPFSPPEDWYEPTGAETDYQIKVQDPGDGFVHVLTPNDVRSRLAEMPAEFLHDLEVVQLSRMTRKKLCFPCYGMQWGSALYLYPVDDSYTETFYDPPQTTFVNEARMYGGRWTQEETTWTLHWSEAAIRDFYLNNILIHELGHLLDERNSTYVDRERYAEWFAIQYGYRGTGGINSRRPNRKVCRRHHSC